MSADIGGMVFFEQLLEDGEIEPDLGDKRLQNDDGELSDEKIPKIVIFLTILTIDQSTKSLQKQLQRGVNM